MKTKLLKIINVLTTLICCFAFTACNEDMMPEDGTLRTSANTGTMYMQDFIPDRNAAVGAEVMLTDKRDNIVYRCIKMADGRWWMGENLKYNVTGSFFYGNDSTNLAIYGRLYDWTTHKDYVPEGWSLPTNAEWTALADALGGKAGVGGKMKSTTGWNDYNGTSGNGTNESGWDGLPGGYYYVSGSYNSKGTNGNWWAAEKYGGWRLNNANLISATVNSNNRYSVRCILKETVQYMQDFTPAGNEAVGAEVMLTDKRDSIVYRCIKMADGRWWMGENLKYNVTGSFFYGNDSTNLAIYGRLYDWTTHKDYVPEGWSLPTNAEWTALADALGGKAGAGGKMKSTTGWNDYNGTSGNGTNESGWNGLPGGYYYVSGSYNSKGTNGNWWAVESYGGWRLNNTNLISATVNSNNRYSVRCILNQ